MNLSISQKFIRISGISNIESIFIIFLVIPIYLNAKSIEINIVL